jgi:nitrogen regulatory protein PII
MTRDEETSSLRRAREVLAFARPCSVRKLMKKIEAIFVPEKFDQVRDGMNKLNVEQFLMSRLTAHQPESAAQRRWGDEWHDDLCAPVKFEVFVPD